MTLCLNFDFNFTRCMIYNEFIEDDFHGHSQLNYGNLPNTSWLVTIGSTGSSSSVSVATAGDGERERPSSSTSILLSLVLKYLKSKEKKEGQHQTEQSHGLRQDKSKNSVGEKRLLQGWFLAYLMIRDPSTAPTPAPATGAPINLAALSISCKVLVVHRAER